MGDTLKRKARKLQEQVAPTGNAKVNSYADGTVGYRVACRVCRVGATQQWSTFQKDGNSYADAVTRWEQHTQSSRHQRRCADAPDAEAHRGAPPP